MILAVENIFRRITVDSENLKKNFSISIKENHKTKGCIGRIFYVELKTTETRLDLVVKLAPFDRIFRLAMAVKENFWNECLFYGKVLPEFRALQSSSLGKIEIDPTPKCYLAENKEPEEKLILQDLRSFGYELHDKRQPFDDKHMEMVFVEYARFHALSFALKAKFPGKFQWLTEQFKEIYRRINPKLFGDQLRLVYGQCWDFFKNDRDGKLKEKLKKYYKDGVEIFFGSLEDDKQDFSVLVHGDCWSNNLMFKYDKFRTLLDVKLIDFQASNLRSPVHDLSYCLYSNGCYQQFSSLNHYLQIYHDSLKTTLATFSLNVNSVYPYEKLLSDWRKYCRFGFSMALLLLKFKLTYDDMELDMPDILNAKNGLKEMEASRYDKEQVEKKYKELVRHMHERGFL